VIKKIIFFVGVSFSQRDFDRFGIELLETNGFEVEIWEFTPIVNYHGYKELSSTNCVQFKQHKFIFSKAQAHAEMDKLDKETFVICLIIYPNFVYHMISQYKVNYALLLATALPVIREKKISLARIKYILQLNPRKLFAYIVGKLFILIGGITPPALILAGGERSLTLQPSFSEESEILWTHALDYDIYMKYRNMIHSKDKRQAVFLDEDLPFHDDYINLGIKKRIARPEEYYPLLKSFFEIMEKIHAVEIVIAAHPRSRYEEYPDFFGGRPVIKGNTAELVGNASFVISHCSTAINFAVLFRKPIIFVTTNKLRQHQLLGPLIENMAFLLKKKVFNLDERPTVDLEQELCIDDDAYLTYQNLYIKKEGSPAIPFWQIVANRLKQFY
jgi:hypothetical protein